MNTGDERRATRARAAVGIALPLALIVLTLLPLLLFRDRLPDPLATHWGVGGNPNGKMSFTGLLLFDLVFIGVPAAFMAIVARRIPAYRGTIMPVVAVTSFVAAMVAVASWEIVAANLDATTWTEAAPLGWAEVARIVVSALVVAALAAMLSRWIETAPAPQPFVPRPGRRSGSSTVWVGKARAAWALPLVVAFFLTGMVVANAVGPIGLSFVFVGLVGLPFTSIRVTADRHGVRIDYGAFGWPTQRVSLADIREAAVIDVVPLQHGGWGYRGSRRIFGRAAIVLRGGEGIQLDLARNRKLIITVDDAADGACVINDLVAALGTR